MANVVRPLVRVLSKQPRAVWPSNRAKQSFSSFSSPSLSSSASSSSSSTSTSFLSLSLLPLLAAAAAAAAAMPTAAADDGASKSKSEALLLRASSSEGKRKDSVVANYENRVREMSNPEKVFEHFASVKKGSGVDRQSFMTSADFLRALIPNCSAEDVADAGDLKFIKLADTDGDGLISFDEYIFFITLLEMPASQFRIAFRMFDLDGNGTVDREEFESVMDVMQKRSVVASQSRSSSDEESGLVTYFFPKKNTKLTVERFLAVLDDLQTDVLRHVFDQLDKGKKGKISARVFAKQLLSAVKVRKQAAYAPNLETMDDSKLGQVSFNEYKEFKRVLDHLGDLETALSLIVARGTPFSPDDLKRAGKVVAGVTISDSIVHIIFHLLGADEEVGMDVPSFMAFLESTRTQGLSKQRDTGFIRSLEAIWSCVQDAM